MQNKKSNLRYRDNIYQFKEIFKSFIPQNKNEILILFLFILFYTSYSIIIALDTSVIDYKDALYDIYFSFDNPIIYRQGYVYVEGHPLMMYMTMPFIFIGNILGGILGYKAKTLFLTFICTILISLSNVYVYRYLTRIVEIKGYIVYLLIIFYGFTATNLILCFTPESFTITVFFLSFTIFFYSDYIKRNKSVRLGPNIFFATILGGITITNFAKGLIPILFTNDRNKIKIRKIIIASFFFSIIILWIQFQYNFISLIQSRLSGNISVPARGNYFEKIFEWLYAGPIFFPKIMMLNINVDGMPFGAISIDFYHYWWQFLFAVILLAIILYSVIKNRRNKLVQLIVLSLAIDITIHAIIRYGIRDAFIYGGHWIFFIPLIIGWGYKKIENKRVKNYANIVFTILTLGMIINNISVLSEFVRLALKNFIPYVLK